MLIYGDNNMSQFKICLEAAHNFLLSKEKAHEIFGNLTDAIEQHWKTVCEEAELNEVDKKLLWRRQFLNPYAVEH
jgi:serine/threonine-protein kinase HipA